MNPVFCQKAFRVATYPIKSMGIILRKSSYRRRDFFSMTLGRRGQQNICNAAERNSRMLGMSSFRLFSTQPVQSQSNTGIYLFGVISGVGMMGGLYYYSSILKNTPIFQQAIDALKHCPMVMDLIGSEFTVRSLSRGKVNEKEARVTFIINGKNGEFLVTLEGECDDNGELGIKTLSMHHRGKFPAEEHFIYENGVLVSKLVEDEKEEVEVNVVEEISRDERV